jgi:transglutaminase-like putative cysteine protease
MRSHHVAVALITFCLIAPQRFHGQETAASPLPNGGGSETRRVSFTLQYRITGKQGTEKAVLTALVPKTIEGRQKILKVKYTPRPEREFEEKGNKYARFALVRPVGEQLVTIDVEAELYRYDLDTAAKNVPSLAPRASEIRGGKPESNDGLKPWLVHEKFIEKDALEIQAAAKAIGGADELDTIRNIMAFVHQKVRYTGYDETDHGALWALKNGKGDCTEFSDLFVALCRAKNIPARVWEGYLTDDVPKGDTAKHIRAEAYTRKHGWVPFDALHVLRGNAKFESLKPVYVYLGNQRSDPLLQNYHYAAYRYFGQPVTFDFGFTLTEQRELKKR